MWNTLIVDPMTNALLFLYSALGQNFVLAIAVFTIIIRLVTLPLNIRQQKSSLRMQEMQPIIREIQQKHRDNPQKMQEEFAKVGYNPVESITGCLPLLIQMPVLFGLFSVLRTVLGTTPQSLYELAERIYPWLPVDLTTLLPIESTFLGLNLGQPDPTFVLPILVFATMFVQQKFLMPSKDKKDDDNSKGGGKGNSKKKQQQPADDPTAAMTQSMQYTMPIMFGFFSLQFQAGLSVYFVLSNLIGIGQGFYTRRVMEQEKAARAEAKKRSPKKETVVQEEQPEYEPETPETLAARQNGSKRTSKGSKSKSKRKRRSAKR